MGENSIKLHRRFIKNYRKNTIAVVLSFALTFLLLTTMLVLMHTNHRIANIQDKTVYTPSDCYIKDLTEEQLIRLEKDEEIEHLGTEQEEHPIYKRNNQTIFLTEGDSTAMTMMCKVVEGREPEQEGEVAAERWVLLNLGIEPSVNQEFSVQDADIGEDRQFKLVGILSDISGNKKYGSINLYAPLNKKENSRYVAYLQLQKNINYEEKMKSLRSELGIRSKQIRECPARENFRELYQTDVKIIGVILVVCMVVFYGVYRIASIAREKQYGILRAVGMKRKQLQKMILMELYQIYLVSVPCGIVAGLLLSYFIIVISGDGDLEVYLYNKSVQFLPVIPFWQIAACVAITAVLIGFVGYLAGRKVVRAPVTETIAGSLTGTKEKKSRFNIGKANSKTSALIRLGCKYIFRDGKTSCFVILTISVGVTLFTGLAYRALIVGAYHNDTREMWYLNGQYAMTMQYLDSPRQGISREDAEVVRDISQVSVIKTASGMPVRVVDDDHVKRNDEYYNEINKKLEKFYGFANAGYDGNNQIYKSILYGYNPEALKELKKYVVSGDFNPDNIGEDEIILSVLRTDDTKENNTPGSYKEGTPLMEYQAGDEIQIKYRADLKTDSNACEQLTDSDAEYIYKTYKIAAIVSFEYMYDCNRTVYPLLITSDRQIRKIAPDSGFQCMYVDGSRDMDTKEQTALEQQLIRICNQSSDVSTRSLISDIRQNEMFYRKQMVYVCGIAIVAFVLVMINMVNNLRYRMQTRTREISMLRAIGLSVAMTKRMLLFENIILGLAGVAVAFLATQPVLRYLYRLSDMKAFGHPFLYDYPAFAGAAAGALGICAVLSFGILKSWKTRFITEGIGNLE